MRKFFKWTGITLAGLLGLLVLFYITAYCTTEIRFHRKYDVKASTLSFATSPTAIEEGKHFVTAIGKCVDCHGENFGGKVIFDQPIFGRVVAPNLTAGAGSVTKNFSDADWERAIRHGVAPGGRGLLVMPSKDFYPISDGELNAIVAYIKSLPAVNSSLPEINVGPLARILNFTGQMPLVDAEDLDHTALRPPAPPMGATVEYGKHMAETGGCTSCHGPTLSGGKIPGAPPTFPPARNLTADLETGIGKWTEADFFRALREGKRPNGDTLLSPMPWRYTAQLKDDEIKALYLYLHSVPSKKFGNR